MRFGNNTINLEIKYKITSYGVNKTVHHIPI